MRLCNLVLEDPAGPLVRGGWIWRQDNHGLFTEREGSCRLSGELLGRRIGGICPASLEVAIEVRMAGSAILAARLPLQVALRPLALPAVGTDILACTARVGIA
jgi:hypothetical protein